MKQKPTETGVLELAVEELSKLSPDQIAERMRKRSIGGRPGTVGNCPLGREGIDNVFMREARELIDGEPFGVERADEGAFEVCDDGDGPYWFGGCPGDNDSLRFAVGEALELEPGGLSWPVGSRVYGYAVTSRKGGQS